MNYEQKDRYESIVESYEAALSLLNVKEFIKFKGLSGKGIEHSIGLAYMYFLIVCEQSILLTNDKKLILAGSWEDVKKIFSNGGKVVTSVKKLREYIENDMINNSHLA
jgi:hypothetical protein